MKTLISLPFLLLVLFSPCSHAKEPIRIFEGVVTKVSDGDTIHVRDRFGTNVKVRLYGIDAPETEKRNRKTGRVSKKGQPFGEEAFAALTAKVYGRPVKVEVIDIDRYKRAVSIVRMVERNINSLPRNSDCSKADRSSHPQQAPRRRSSATSHEAVCEDGGEMAVFQQSVNAALVSEGVAWAYREYLDRPYASEYLQAEEGARKGKRGLWQQPNPQPPWEFRRSQKAKRYALR